MQRITAIFLSHGEKQGRPTRFTWAVFLPLDSLLEVVLRVGEAESLANTDFFRLRL